MLHELLSEANLKQVLEDLLPKGTVILTGYSIPGVDYSPTCYLPDLKLAVDVDGPIHFTDNATVVNDGVIRAKLTEAGLQQTRIPYFVQLDKPLARVLFHPYGVANRSGNRFDHGFLGEDDVLPGQYSSLGARRATRYMNALNMLPATKPVARAVYQSLASRLLTSRNQLCELWPIGSSATLDNFAKRMERSVQVNLVKELQQRVRDDPLTKLL